MDFKEKVYFLRKRKGLTQDELGKLANVSQKTIQAYEKGRIKPRTNSVIVLAKALGTKPEILTDDTKRCE